MFFLGYRRLGGDQAYIRNTNLPADSDKWYFPQGDTDFCRRLAKALVELANDIDGAGIRERKVQ